MSTRDIIQAAAGASGPATYVEDVFSTNLYTGNGISQKIDTGITKLSDEQSFTWNDLYKNSQHCYINGIRAGTSYNYYIIGSVFGSGKYLIKLNSFFVIQWQKKLTSQSDAVLSFDIDGGENIYVVGYGNNGSTDYYAHIYKYDTYGTLQWQKSFKQNSSSSTYANGVAYNYQFGIISVCGSLYDGSNISGFLASYTSSGTLQWQRQLYNFTTKNTQIAYSGDSYVIGTTSNNEAIITKFNSSGTRQWKRRLYEGVSTGIDNCVVDNTGCYILGSGTSNGTYLFFAKYDTTGAIQWQQKIICSTKDFDQSIGKISKYVTNNADLYIVGLYSSKKKIYVAKFDQYGNCSWQTTISNKNIPLSSPSWQDYFGSLDISIDSSLSKVYITCSYYINSLLYNKGAIIQLNSDGSIINNTQSNFVIEPADCAVVTGTATDATEINFFDAAGGATDSSATATDATESVSISSTTAPSSTGYGGLVWIKDRTSSTKGHVLFDTVATSGAYFLTPSGLSSPTISSTSAKTSGSGSTNIRFNTTGFVLGTDTAYAVNNYYTSDNYVSWIFRKQVKFFDIITYTGTGVARTIAHNLGSTPGCIIVKCTSTGATDWRVYHVGLTSAAYTIQLNQTNAQSNQPSIWNSTAPTSSVFSVGGGDPSVNSNGDTYVAYLFAHNAGGFGPNGTDNIISCGSYTGNGSATGPSINLGYEPQWVLIKNASTTGGWVLADNMRGLVVGGNDPYLMAQSANAEDGTFNFISPTATGFNITTTNTAINGSGNTIIYIAIRRGPMKVPTSGTSVFMPIKRTGSGAVETVAGGGFASDVVFTGTRDQPLNDRCIYDRVRGAMRGIYPRKTNAEEDQTPYANSLIGFDVMDGFRVGIDVTYQVVNMSGYWYIHYNFRRAPGFFDVVCYTGNDVSRNLNHNLGVSPQLWIVKARSTSVDWTVGSSLFSSVTNDYLSLNLTDAKASLANFWNAPTATTFGFGSGMSSAANINAVGNTYVAYLFASCPGVSKVGSFTGNGTSQTINCGFSAGARFILVKRTDSTGDWYVWDTARGIVAANDPHLSLNTTAAEVTTDDSVDPDSTGFIVNQVAATNINVSSATYIYLAIA